MWGFSGKAKARIAAVVVRLALVIVRKYVGKCGAFSGKAEARLAAIWTKHSVQTFMSVTRLRHDRFVWQQEPSACTCQDSGCQDSVLLRHDFLYELRWDRAEAR